MKTISTGNATVDAIAQLNIEGNVIPTSWYQHVKYTNTRGTYADLLAISLLADLVYWYRPSEVRDESTGHVVGWKKKFKGDKFQRNYEAYANLFGVSYKQVILAADLLSSLGLANRTTGTTRNSRTQKVIGNVLYWSIDPLAIAEITYRIDPEVLRKSTKPNYRKPEDSTTEPSIPNGLTGNKKQREDKEPVSRNGVEATPEMGCTYTDISFLDSNHEIKQKHKQADRSHSSDQVCELETLIQEEERRIDSESEAEILKGVPREEIKQPSNDAELNPGIETKKSRSKTNQEKTQSGKKDKQNPPTPLSRRAAQNEVAPVSVRVQAKKGEAIKFRINSLGWLQLPRNKRYFLARGIAVRRLQHQLAVMFEDVDFLRYEDGTIASEGNRTAMTWDDGKQLEGDRECFSRSGAFDLTSIRDQLFVKGMLGQGVFNDLLEAIFVDSVKWCEGQSANAQFVLEKTPIAHLFADNDLQLARSIKEKYEVEI